ncbi:MAG: hypothetical protein Tsb008_07150 [Rhodothalassiaceae bacterium]
MRGLVNILLALSLIAAAGGLNVMKHRVETRRETVEALEQRILEDIEALHVLEAERAYLTSPAALRERALRHLRLTPLLPERILDTPASLPYRIERLEVAQAADDIRLLPEPRMKPRAPANSAAMALAAHKEVADEKEAEDFALRIERAIERGDSGR